MQKENHPQLELFSETKGAVKAKTRTLHDIFFGYIRTYEKVLLIIIAFGLTGIAAFSLGVEKGKRISRVTPVQITPAQTENKVIKQTTEHQPSQYYTVQIASYQSKGLAQKEAEVLRKKGFSPLVLSKGKYVIVCVGNFSDQNSARALLAQLKKRYRDCIIRRI